MKTGDIAKKLWTIYSDGHTVLSWFKGDKKPDIAGIAKADPKGKGQMDERLTLAALARAIERASKEHRISKKEARKRACDIIKFINKEYNPEQLRLLSLTFGLQQTPISTTSNNKNEGSNSKAKQCDQSIPENREGQDIFLSLILADSEEFTKEICDFAVFSYRLHKEKLEKWQENILDFIKKTDKKLSHTLDAIDNFLGGSFEEISLNNPDGFYDPPFWVDLVPPFMRERVIEKCRQKYLENLKNNGGN